MRKQREDRSKACQRTGDLWDVRAAEARSHVRESTVLRGKEKGPLSSVFSVIVPNPEGPYWGSWIEWSFQEFPGRGGKNMQAQIATASPPPSLPQEKQEARLKADPSC